MAVLRGVWGVSAFLIHTTLFCQPTNFESLSIDRPDVSNLPTTIRPGHYQIELGIELSKTDGSREYNVPNFLLRTGLNNRSEVRLGVTHDRIDSDDLPSEKSLINTLSFKYRFLDEKGIVPSIALQPDINFEFTEGRTNPELDYALILLFNNSLHEKIFINYNAGVLFKNEANQFLLSASMSFMHSHRLGYFFEIFNVAEQIALRYLSVDGGITYLVRPRFQLDIYVGTESQLESDRIFFGLGAGFRLDSGDLRPKSFKDIGIHH
jgi:hypothetical protein